MTVPGTAREAKEGAAAPELYPSAPLPLDRRRRPTALYRFFQADGQLLYVGITSHLRGRWRDHSRTYATTWWPKVSSNSVQWYSTRGEAEQAERKAIANENPLFNVMHTPRSRVPQGKRLGLAAAADKRAVETLSLLTEAFGTRHFTSADAAAAAIHVKSKSAIARQIRALVERGQLAVVGSRHVLTDGEPRRSRTLYALPIHEWRDGKTGAPIAAHLPPPPLRRGSAAPEMGRRKSQAATPASLDTPAAEVDVPPAVTFQTGAALLIQLGIAEHITHQGIRHIAKTAQWPFGEGRTHPYWTIGNAAVMETGPFLAFFRSYQLSGKGPDKEPRGPRTAGDVTPVIRATEVDA